MRKGRVRTPMILQMEAVECGAAALAIVLAYYRRIVPLADLRRDCGVSRDGSKLSNICKAAATYGLIAKPLKKDIPKLKDLKYPYIVFWNFNHFLVVEGFHKGQVYLNDPATGRRSVQFEEFDRSYTGVCLTLEPGPEFRRGGHKPSVLGGLWRRIQTSLIPICAAICASLLLVAPNLAIPALLQAFVDKVLIEGSLDWGRPLVLGMLLAAAAKALLYSIELRVLRRLQIRLATANSSRFVMHLLRLPASYYAQRYAGEVSSRIGLNDQLSELVAGKVATTAIDVLMMVFYLLVMTRFSGILASVAAGFALLNFAVLWWIARKRVEGNIRLGMDTGKTAGAGISGLQSIRTLKASALESDFFERWSGFFANLWNTQQELSIWNYCAGVLPPLVTALMTVFILVVGGFQVMEGRLTIGQLVAFQALTASFLLPVNALVGLGASLQEVEAQITRLDDVLRNPVAEDPKLEEAMGMPLRLHGQVEFRNVSFRYSPVSPTLISNLSFRVSPGQRIAFVGGSGSGKSTILKLLVGLYPPSEGEILIDDIPLHRIPREILAHSIAMVEQDVLLFQGTVRSNLTLWDASTPEASVIQACRDAQIHDVLQGLRDGYASELLEGAANLSGGQRQRLEIARALASDPAILVLDEATSALDSETELLVDRNIRRRGCTCCIVAHRLSTIRDSDEILVLDAGQVVQRGTHDELIRQEGVYVGLFAEGGSA